MALFLGTCQVGQEGLRVLILIDTRKSLPVLEASMAPV